MDIIDFRKSYPALLVPLQSWNAFEDFSDQQPFQNVPKSSNQNQDALHHSSTSDEFLNLNVLEVAIYLLC